MLRAWLNPENRWLRWIRKGGLLAIVFVAVLYPRPVLLLRNINHWRDLGALIDPDAPGLDPLVELIRERLPDQPDPAVVLSTVESVVYARIPYAWDWEVWGVVDYVPTVNEVLERGREDCDGQAVVAASILRRLGYEAELVSDLTHVWVATPRGNAMSPVETASGHAFVETTDDGTQLDWKAVLGFEAILIDWPSNLAFGIAVFPIWREAIVVVAIWTMMLGRVRAVRRDCATFGLLIVGWVLLRMSGAAGDPVTAWLGIAVVALGLSLGVFRRERTASDPRETAERSPASATLDA